MWSSSFQRLQKRMFALLMKSKPWRLSFSSRILFTSATFLLGVGSFLSFLRNIDEYAICDDGLLSWILFNVFMISSLSAFALLLFMSFVPACSCVDVAVRFSDLLSCLLPVPHSLLPVPHTNLLKKYTRTYANFSRKYIRPYIS